MQQFKKQCIDKIKSIADVFLLVFRAYVNFNAVSVRACSMPRGLNSLKVESCLQTELRLNVQQLS